MKINQFLPKGITLLLVFLITIPVFSQPVFVEGDFAANGGFNNNIGTLTDRGSHRFFRIQSSRSTGTGTLLFNNASDNYSPKWTANNSTPLAVNTVLSGGAVYNGASDINFNVTQFNYYTLIIGENSGSSNDLSLLETSYNPTAISSVSQSPSSVYAGQQVTVTVTMAGALNSGELLYLRYTTDGWTSSSFVQISSLDGSHQGTAVIPARQSGTVDFYILTTPNLTPTHSTADFVSLNIYNQAGQNVAGSNYSYTVQAWSTVQNGNWSSSSTWNANQVPPTATSIGAVSIGHVVALDQDAIINGGTISGSGNLTVNSGSTLKTTNGLTNNGTFTVTGTFEINAGGYTNTAPVYSSGSTLTYNTGGAYSRNSEWNTTSPYHVVVTGSTTLNLGSGSTAFSTGGNLTIASGSAVSLQTMTNTLTVTGDLSVSGTLTLSTNSGGDLISAGNLTFAAGSTFNANSRAIFFTGTSGQTLTNTAAVSLAYLIVNKPSGNLILGTDLTLAGTAGDVLQILNDGQVDLNGHTLTLSGNGGNLLAGSSTGGTERTIGGTTGTLAVTGTKTVTSTSSRTLAFGSGVTVLLTSGLNFGISLSTVYGTLQINNGGYVATNAPTFASGSVLKYNTGTTYGRATEWSATTGAGYPYHVQISNSTTLDLGNGGTGTARQMAGNLTVDAGSTLSLNVTAMTAGLTVLGTSQIDGTLTLSASSGGDFYTFNDVTIGSSGSLTPNNRAIFFRKQGVQTLTKTGSGTVTIPYVLIGGAGNVTNLTLASGTNLTATAPSGGNALAFNSSSDALTLNGNTLTVSAGGISGSGTITGSASSTVSVAGTGDAGTIRFTTGSETLNSLTVNRTSGGKLTLGTNLAVTGTLILTAGELALGSNTLSVSGVMSRTSGTMTSVSGAGSLSVTGTGSAGTVAFTPGSNSLGSLTLNRTSSGLLSLASDLTVTSALTVTAGNLDLNGNNILTLTSAASLSESPGATVLNSNGSGTGYISFSATPGVTLTNYNGGGLGLLLTTSSDPGAVQIRRYHTERSVSGAASLKRYYFVSLGNNTGTSLTLNYDQTNELNYLLESNLVLYNSADGTTWSEQTGGTLTLDALNNSVAYSGLSGYSSYYTAAEKYFTSVSGGNWNSASTWSGGSIPSSGNSVSISHAVTLDVNASVGSLVISGGSLDLSSSQLTFSDGARFTNNGTFTPSTGTVVFSGSARIDGSSAPAFTNLTANSGTISTFGNWSVTSFTKGTSTIAFRDAGNISSATSFYNLTLEYGTRVLQANIDVEGTLTLEGGDFQSSSAHSLTLSGSNSQLLVNGSGTITGVDVGGGNDLSLVVTGALATVGGTRSVTGATLGRKFYTITVNPGSILALDRGIMARYGAFTVNGTLQINANGFVETSVGSSSNAAYGASGSLTYSNGGSYTTTSGEWPSSSGPANVTVQNNSTITLVAATPKTLTGDLTLTSGTLDDNSNTLTVNGDVTGTSGVHTGSGKILLTGGATHSVGGVTLGNLELNDAAGAALNGSTVVAGILTLTDGSLTVGSQSLEIRNPLAGTTASLSAGTTSTLIAGGSASGISIPVGVTALNNFSVTNVSAGGVTLLAGLILENDLTIGAGSVLNTGSFSVTVKGDVTCNGTQTGPGQILMQGNTAAAAIMGSGVFENLELDDSDGFTLSGNPSVSGTLTMTSGNISTGSNVLILGTSGSVTGTLVHSSGRIFGKFRRWFGTSTASNRIFPIGIVTANTQVDLSFTSAPTTAGTVTAAFVSHSAGMNGLPVSDGGYVINATANSGYWTITAGNGLSGGTYDLALTGENFNGVTDYSQLRLLKRTDSSSPWTLAGTHVAATGSNASPVIRRSGLTGFSDFTAGSDKADNSLPVELSSFSAVQHGKKISISWTTESETNNAGFFVFRSLGSEPPVLVNQALLRPAQSGSSSRTEYRMADEFSSKEPVQVTYSIKSVDLSGEEHQFGLISVLDYQPVPEKFALGQNYPNPFNPETRFTLDLPEDGSAEVVIFSVTGQKVKTLLAGFQTAGRYSVTWNGTTDSGEMAATGLYWYRVTSSSGTAVKKMQLIR